MKIKKIFKKEKQKKMTNKKKILEKNEIEISLSNPDEARKAIIYSILFEQKF